MKLVFKTALVGAALVASTAFADVSVPSSGNGELTLFVRDANNASHVYARGLGITVNDILNPSVTSGPDASFNGVDPHVGSFNYSLPAAIPADQNLTNFLASGTSFVWTVLAADTDDSSFLLDTGEFRFAFTTQINLNTFPSGTPNNGNIEGVWTNVEAMMQSLNSALPDGSGTSVTSGGLWGQSGTLYDNGGSWFGGNFNNENILGSAANLYFVSNSNDNGLNLARTYADSIQLRLTANGTLENVGGVVNPPQVPLPAAVWLLGSALVGVAGIRRRRPEAAV